MGTTVISIAILVFAIVTFGAGVRIVPQGEEWIVQRLGKYRVTLLPGLRFRVEHLDGEVVVHGWELQLIERDCRGS